MKNHSIIFLKAFLCILVLLIFGLTACTAKEPQQGEQQEAISPVEPVLDEPPIAPTLSTLLAEAALQEVNIYHLGIRTTLDINEDQAMAIASQFLTLLAKAAETDGMEAPPEVALNPIQVKNSQTALELICSKPVELPQTIDKEPLTAKQLLFSIPISSSEGGLLYIGHELYEKAPIGCLYDATLQNSIFNDASDQVERVIFSEDGTEVTIVDDSFSYVNDDDNTALSDKVLNRVLYRAMAFYKNAYTGNVDSLQAMCSGTLYAAVMNARAGIATENILGEEIVANFNSYILSDYFLPQSITAPKKQGDDYQVLFYLNDMVTVEMHFMLEEDLPLISSISLVITN